jgi:hypothetical protein
LLKSKMEEEVEERGEICVCVGRGGGIRFAHLSMSTQSYNRKQR